MTPKTRRKLRKKTGGSYLDRLPCGHIGTVFWSGALRICWSLPCQACGAPRQDWAYHPAPKLVPSGPRAFTRFKGRSE